MQCVIGHWFIWRPEALSSHVRANVGRETCGTVTSKMETPAEQDLDGREVAVHGPECVSETDAFSYSPYVRPRNNRYAVAADTKAKGSGCERDAEEYNMCHPRRGVALIFNHQKFDRMAPRAGSDEDCHNLSVHLNNLGFEIQVYNDLSYAELSDVLTKTAARDHLSADCLLVVVMTHGDPGYLHSRDTTYPTEKLWSPFKGDKCSSLVGKPKLFFIQACRGTLVDAGVEVDETDSYSMGYSLPTQADFLIAYSTVEGYYSWRNPSRGSWFIQALCEELRLHGRTRDLMTLLTFVCRRVAIDYQSNVPADEEMDQKKQIPSIISMLTRLVYFGQKQQK